MSDLRSWLDLLGTRGDLVRLAASIEPDQDVAAVLERADGARTVLFEDVAGARFPLVGNTVPTHDHLGLALGCAPGDVAERFAEALDRPRACPEVAAADAPVLGNRFDGEALLSVLPLVRQHEHDAGRYLTSALLAVRDRASGRMNLSINRMLATGERELRVLVLPGRLRRILAEAEAAGQDLDVALVIGVHPVLVLASQAPAERDLDDYAVAGALAPAPIELVAAPTVDALVPARAEVVLEGRFTAGQRAEEGPFGEYPQTYGPAAPAPVMELLGGWHRDDALFQTILSGGREHMYAGGVPREAHCTRALRRAGLDVAGLRLPESGSCRLSAVVALRNPAPGAVTTAILTLFLAAETIKQVTVVDDDIDVLDDEQIAWAVATRVQADHDLLVVPRAKGSSLDPSAGGPVTAKLGIDATVPAGSDADRERYRRMRVGPTDPARVRAHLAALGL
ncbi:UbiD family decarboxylase [Pseudonocardia xinjiangensis]|uniref:UbiD family decarboxylase n=1 Tax=Pseudonocardia xinjiangensis TaxID=75289 RepID=UPI003D941226